MSNTVKIIVQADLSGAYDTPGAKVLWPLPRDEKIDVVEVLKTALDNFAITDIPVGLIGSVSKSTLRKKTDKEPPNDWVWVPNIVVRRSFERAERMGIGEMAGIFVNVDGEPVPAIVSYDQNGNPVTVPAGQVRQFRAQTSQTSIDIVIVDADEYRIDQLYKLVKLIMFATANSVFMEELGYLNVIREGGGDDDPSEVSLDGGNYVLFTRTLTYGMSCPFFVAGIPRLAELIQQTLTVEEQGIESATFTAVV